MQYPRTTMYHQLTTPDAPAMVTTLAELSDAFDEVVRKRRYMLERAFWMLPLSAHVVRRELAAAVVSSQRATLAFARMIRPNLAACITTEVVNLDRLALNPDAKPYLMPETPVRRMYSFLQNAMLDARLACMQATATITPARNLFTTCSVRMGIEAFAEACRHYHVATYKAHLWLSHATGHQPQDPNRQWASAILPIDRMDDQTVRDIIFGVMSGMKGKDERRKNSDEATWLLGLIPLQSDPDPRDHPTNAPINSQFASRLQALFARSPEAIRISGLSPAALYQIETTAGTPAAKTYKIPATSAPLSTRAELSRLNAMVTEIETRTPADPAPAPAPPPATTPEDPDFAALLRAME